MTADLTVLVQLIPTDARVNKTQCRDHLESKPDMLANIGPVCQKVKGKKKKNYKSRNINSQASNSPKIYLC